MAKNTKRVTRRIRMDTFGEQLLLSRARGREVGSKLPKAPSLSLDFTGVEAASPSFLDELIRTLFAQGTLEINFRNVNEQTMENLMLLRRLNSESGRPAPDVMVG